MRAYVLVNGIEETMYTFPELASLEASMTAEEKELAQVRGYLIKGVEPGGDDVYAFRIAREDVGDEIGDLLFGSAEIDCRGVVARGYARAGQTGSIEASVTFNAMSVRPIDRKAIVEENKRRQDFRTGNRKAQEARRSAMTALKAQIEARTKAAGK